MSDAESQHGSPDRFLCIKKLLTNKKFVYFTLYPYTNNETNKQIKPNLDQNMSILGVWVFLRTLPFYI